MFGSLLTFASRILSGYLYKETCTCRVTAPLDPAVLKAVLQPGDVILVEGTQRISAAIKYLTQSTWSHAAFFAGEIPHDDPNAPVPCLIEADARHGVVTVPLEKYTHHHLRICRAVGIRDSERQQLVDFMKGKIGLQYDLKNILDLLRYLLPEPPVPMRWRRRMLALGSGDPTRAICSTLIAQAFQSIHYPILPVVHLSQDTEGVVKEILHIRHHSLFTPRDFDISPYFDIVKPTLSNGFDHHTLVWTDAVSDIPATKAPWSC